MTTTSIESMLEYLQQNPDDWQCRRELADAYEEIGNNLLSSYYKWSVENQKYPESQKNMVNGLWYEWWWEEATYAIAPCHSKIGTNDFWKEMRRYLGDHHCIYEYRHEKMAVVEYHLALFLRHKGII